MTNYNIKEYILETQIKLEHKITTRWLLIFALPTILSSIFMNLYSTVDGIFVARFVDTNALSAINITMPMTYLASALGMMFGTGGNALVARKMARDAYRKSGRFSRCLWRSHSDSA